MTSPVRRRRRKHQQAESGRPDPHTDRAQDAGPFENLRRSDAALIGQAARNGWEATEASRERISGNLFEAMGAGNPGLVASVIRAVVEMRRADLKRKRCLERVLWKEYLERRRAVSKVRNP